MNDVKDGTREIMAIAGGTYADQGQTCIVTYRMDDGRPLGLRWPRNFTPKILYSISEVARQAGAVERANMAPGQPGLIEVDGWPIKAVDVGLSPTGVVSLILFTTQEMRMDTLLPRALAEKLLVDLTTRLAEDPPKLA